MHMMGFAALNPSYAVPAPGDSHGALVHPPLFRGDRLEGNA
jgi:hypothetical protein